jgi:hypothetical protein
MEVRLERKLTLVPLIIVGIACMTQMAGFDAFGIISDLTEGHRTLPGIVIFAAGSHFVQHKFPSVSRFETPKAASSHSEIRGMTTGGSAIGLEPL